MNLPLFPKIGFSRIWILIAVVLSLSVILFMFECKFMPVAVDPLTRDERRWLRSHPVIRVAPDPDFQPVEYFDANGRYRGISADYLALIEKNLGVHFEIIRLKNWDEILEHARNRQIDMFGAAAKTLQRTEYMLFTSPYLEIPAVLITPKRAKGSLSLDGLKGKSVSVISHYAAHDYISRKYPDIQLDVVPDIRTGLHKVSFGDSDAFVENLLTTTFYLEREGISNLRVAGEAGFLYREAFASRQDWPELNRILEKGLAGISASEKEIIYKKWVPLEFQVLFVSRFFLNSILVGSGIAALILIVGFAWNRSLARQVNRRTAELRDELAERKRIEESLRLSEQRFRVLAETSPAAICVYQGEKIVYVNAAAISMTGYSEEECLEMNFWDLTHEDHRESVMRRGISRQCGQQAPYQYEARSVTKGGEEKWVLISAGLIEYKGSPAGIATIFDISERKRMEDELRMAREEMEQRVQERTAELSEAMRSLGESEEKYRRIVDTAQEGIWTVDQHFHITFMNPRLAGMLGYGVEEIIGKEVETFLYAEDLADHGKQVTQRRLGEGARYERRLRRKDGQPLWALINATPLVDDCGCFHGSFAMIVDITELKKTEAALLKAHAELEIRVEERTEQLASLAAELSLAEERERRRIANELHDQVGQTLAMIKIKLALLTSSSLSPEFEKHFSEIREHINWTIKEIRSLTFQLSPPLLYDIGLGAALEWLGEEFEKKFGIIIEFQDDGKPKLLDEEVRGALYQMVRELLINIVKHAQSKKVFLTYGTFSTGVAITVEDDGAGFDISGRKWYKGENPGFGLFSICNRINHLGGECIIDSSLGQGTRVTLRLPFRQSDKLVPEESLS